MAQIRGCFKDANNNPLDGELLATSISGDTFYKTEVKSGYFSTWVPSNSGGYQFQFFQKFGEVISEVPSIDFRAMVPLTADEIDFTDLLPVGPIGVPPLNRIPVYEESPEGDRQSVISKVISLMVEANHEP